MSTTASESKQAVDVVEVKEDNVVAVPAKQHRLPACIVAYHALLQGTCAANCGQPLVCGAGPGYTKTRIVLDGETARWYHIRCYDTCSEDQWAKHTAQFVNAPDSKFFDNEHAAQCRDVVRHWTFLRDLLPGADLALQCTPWTTPVAPSHLDRMFVHVGADYAARSVWPDVVVANRPGPFQPFYEQMFVTSHFTQFALVWTTSLWSESDAQLRTGLGMIAQHLVDAVATLKPLGPQVYVQPRFYRATADGDTSRRFTVWLRVACQAVHGSALHYEPFAILSQGHMAAQMPRVATLLQSITQQLQDVLQTVLTTTTRTVAEVHTDADEWKLQAVQHRCMPSVSKQGLVQLPVGLTTNRVSEFAYVAVGPKPHVAASLAQLRIQPLDAGQPVFVPYDVSHGRHARFGALLNVKTVEVTPLTHIPHSLPSSSPLAPAAPLLLADKPEGAAAAAIGSSNKSA
jgi:hypothetical protein